PLFCSHCGATYDVRLCPRLHPNPRSARICSQCGSRDLSTPQPHGSTLARLGYFVIWKGVGVLLILLSVLFALALFDTLLTNEQVQGQFLVLLLMLAVAWWAYMKLPSPVRRLLSGVWRRRRRGHGDH
ncbi:MAG: hypothetical protein ACRD96_19475, partial [Bryobacteraceae bacterium]